MELNSIVLTGTMSEICAKLAREVRGFNISKVSFYEWLFLRGREEWLEKQLAHLSEVRNEKRFDD